MTDDSIDFAAEDRAAREAELAAALGIEDTDEEPPAAEPEPAAGEIASTWWTELAADLVPPAAEQLAPNWAPHLVNIADAWARVLDKRWPDPMRAKPGPELAALLVTAGAVQAMAAIPPRGPLRADIEGTAEPPARPADPIDPTRPTQPGAVVASIHGGRHE